jgi:intracellular multiplication protein IcmP
MADKKDTGTSLVTAWAMLLAVLALVVWGVWEWNKFAIMDAIRWIRWAELWVVGWVVDPETVVGQTPAGEPMNFGQLQATMEQMRISALSPLAIEFFSRLTMSYYLIPLSCIFIAMALWAMFYGPGTQNRRRYDMNGLIQTQAPAFPFVAPLIDFNPSEQPFRPPGAAVPADLPPFAEALSPEEWIAHQGIPTLTNKEIDRAAATQAFAAQLGRPWKGWQALTKERQVLLAAFALKSVRKRNESDVMIGELATCWKKGHLHLTGALVAQARKILKSEKLSGKILSFCNQHAFETTAMMRALAYAREEGGVLAPATFVWLRAHDRVLWYPLNNLGRNAYHMEALGAMCHYKAEKLVKRPIVRPKVEGAVDSLAEYMKSFRARPIPQVDYRGSKRRAIKQAGGAA